jgi:tRNA pseudouridine55 synthase
VDEDRLEFEVSCSKGTYVRVLAEDIGLALRTEAHLSSLRRSRFGPFGLEQAVSLENWTPADTSQLLSIREALSDLPTHCVTDRVAESVRQGKTWVLDEIESASDGSLAVLVDSAQEAVAVIARRDGRWSFGRVLNTANPLQPDEPMLANQVE